MIYWVLNGNLLYKLEFMYSMIWTTACICQDYEMLAFSSVVTWPSGTFNLQVRALLLRTSLLTGTLRQLNSSCPRHSDCLCVVRWNCLFMDQAQLVHIAQQNISYEHLRKGLLESSVIGQRWEVCSMKRRTCQDEIGQNGRGLRVRQPEASSLCWSDGIICTSFFCLHLPLSTEQVISTPLHKVSNVCNCHHGSFNPSCNNGSQ